MRAYNLMIGTAFMTCVNGFQFPLFSTSSCLRESTNALYSSTIPSGTGFAKKEPESSKETNETEIDLSSMNTSEVKDLLLDLLPRMKGTKEEFRLVEAYVNALEDSYTPPQTLDFLNLAMSGEWQFLFTTNQLKRPSPSLRLTELTQKLESNGLKGKIINQATWALAEDGTGMSFDSNGYFSASISYSINQGARVTFSEDHDLAVKLAKGSSVPQDFEGLVGLIHRAMPTEMFDPSSLAMDTTFLDPDLRIVRFTGVRHEGVRNIFIRKGTVEINPNL